MHSFTICFRVLESFVIATAIAGAQSHFNVGSMSSPVKNSARLRMLVSSLQASDIAIYLASHEDSATCVCFFDLQDTRSPKTFIENPVADLPFIALVPRDV